MTIFQHGGATRFEHQKRALHRIIQTGGVCAVLFDPGMGKTAIVIDYASLLALKSRTGETRVLVVCPLAAVDTWVKQMEIYASPQVNYWAEVLGGGLLERAEALAARGANGFTKPLSGKVRRASRNHHPRALHHDLSWAWAGKRGGEPGLPEVTQSEGPDGVRTPRLILEVINIDTLTSRARVGSRLMADVMVDAIKRYNPDLIVVDESHKIKAAQGNASRLLARLTRHVQRRILLTGTVMPAGPLDVFGQWRFLEPYAFGHTQPNGERAQATFGGFKERFGVLGGWMGKEVISYKNLDDMQRIMSKNAVVGRKSEALDLPPTMDVELPVELSATEAKAYKEMKEQLATELRAGEWASVPNRLSQMMRLRQITSGHLPDDLTGSVRTIGTSKVRTITSLVHDSLTGEKRIVIFCLFSAEIEMLEKSLQKKGTHVFVITGATSQDERMRMRAEFGSNSPDRIVMVAQIKTMSLAVNELVTANHAIFGSLSQQRDDYIQARDRLDRIGQTRPVTFWHAVALGTVDTVILQSHRDRTSLEDAMLKHISEQSTI